MLASLDLFVVQIAPFLPTPQRQHITHSPRIRDRMRPFLSAGVEPYSRSGFQPAPRSEIDYPALIPPYRW
jgi:hypothetical protein